METSIPFLISQALIKEVDSLVKFIQCFIKRNKFVCFGEQVFCTLMDIVRRGTEEYFSPGLIKLAAVLGSKYLHLSHVNIMFSFIEEENGNIIFF